MARRGLSAIDCRLIGPLLQNELRGVARVERPACYQRDHRKEAGEDYVISRYGVAGLLVGIPSPIQSANCAGILSTITFSAVPAQTSRGAPISS
jgi:hypothetical protein